MDKEADEILQMAKDMGLQLKKPKEEVIKEIKEQIRKAQILVDYTSTNYFHLMNQIRIFSWNIRGISNQRNRSNLGDQISTLKPTLGYLQETKVDNFSIAKLQKCWRNCQIDAICQEAVGLSGGILSMWK